MSSPWDFMNAGHQEAEVKEGGEYSPPPNGTYQAEIVEYSFDLSQCRLKRKYKVLSGEYQGKTVINWLHFMKKDGGINEIAFSIFKSEVNNYDPDYNTLPFETLIKTYLSAVAKAVVDIYVKSERNDKGWNSTVYVNEFHLTDPNSEPEMPF